MEQKTLVDTASAHIRAIVSEIFFHPESARILFVYDDEAPLTQLLSTAYRQALPQAKGILFTQAHSAQALEAIHALSPGDLVILIQSSSFRLDAFRIRIHLFERGLKVIEHPHLGRVESDEFETYIAALAYDANYYRHVGPELKNRLDQSQEVRLINDHHTLVYGGPLELAKLNIGDYRKAKNVGGQLPIGEVFTELKDLTQLNGEVELFAFGDQTFSVFDCKKPILLKIQEGKIAAVTHSVPEFDAVLNDIRQHEGTIWVRELGLGLNCALTREKRIRHDVGIYERMCGVHLSLGSKHALYPKEGFHKRKSKFHVDVFAVVSSVQIDGKTIYEKESYTL